MKSHVVLALVAVAACKGSSGAGEPSGGGSATAAGSALARAPLDATVAPFSDAAGSATVAVISQLETSCAANDFESCRNLAVLVGEGVGRTADLPRAAELFSKACTGGNLAACTALALASVQGRGVAKDVASAVALFQQSCTGGYALACRNLGIMERDGDGIARDLGKAQQLLDRACKLGAPFACTNVGELEASLAPTAIDPKATYQAMIEHYKTGCEANEASACREIGASYALGRGLPKSEASAGVWFAKACKLGDDRACRVLEQVRGGSGSGSGSGATPATP